MKSIKIKCVVLECPMYFLTKVTGKRMPKNVNYLKTGLRYRRRGSKTCSRECAKENVRSRNHKKRIIK